MEFMAVTKSHISCSLLPSSIQSLPKPPSSLQLKQRYQQLPNSSSSSQYSTLDETKQLHAHMIRIPSHQSLAAQFNSLIASYIKNGRPKDALKVYLHMRRMDTLVDNFTVPTILKACGKLSKIQQGQEIHGFVFKMGFDWDVFVQNSLIQMYSECGHTDTARKVFNKMPERDVVSWSTMIGSYSRNQSFDEGLDLIKEMHLCEVKPSEIAMINMINLFADLAVLRIGRAMHGYVTKNTRVETAGIPVKSALIDMYVKCQSVITARKIFDRLSDKSIVSWTAMIAGYIRCGRLEEGLKLFHEMQEQGMVPNEITMLSLVLECGFAGALELGKLLHACMLKNGFAGSPVIVTALVDMYGKCGSVKSARTLFDGMNERDTMSWTAMISVYAQAKCLQHAFDLFIRMKNENMKPNEVTMVNLVLLCAEAGALDLGKWVHTYIDKQGIESDLVLATALIDMYAKCGDIEAAQRIFTEAPNKDVGMWNAMIGGLAMHGYGKEAIELFSQMENVRIKPNDITFVGVLHACSHAGLVEEGSQFFHRMVHEFRLNPKIEHYGCMVDLLGRAGLLNEAHEMIKNMPVKPNTIVWGAFLAGCKLHKSPRLGELAARELLQLEPHNCGYNVLISNIYAAENRWNDVAGVRKIMKDTGLKKEPGFSAIEVNGLIHEFVMGDDSHPQTKKIHEMLAEMSRKLKEVGYVGNTSVVLLNVDEEEKETALTYHSEKLAMAFGLISTAPHTTIRIVKNLRICDDCHRATKLLSNIYSREIIVRDRNRFHHFRQGSCSCKDYW